MKKYLFAVLVLGSVLTASVRGEPEAAKPSVIEVLEAVTNPPCVDAVSDEPYGFPLKVECPFSVSSDILDQAVEMARTAWKGDIKSASVGHLSHPMWAPGVIFTYASYRTNQQSVLPRLRVYFHEAKETRDAGKASCGRDLIRIAPTSLKSSFSAQTNEVFVIGDTDVVMNVRCQKTVVRGKYVSASDIPLDAVLRAQIEAFLKDMNEGRYLYPASPGDLKSLSGKVYPGEQEKKLIPKALALTAFAKVDVDEEFFEDYQSGDDDEVVVYDTLHRGHAMDAYELGARYLQYDAGTSCFDLRWSNGKYSSRGASYCKVDGIWIKSPVYHICY